MLRKMVPLALKHSAPDWSIRPEPGRNPANFDFDFRNNRYLAFGRPVSISDILTCTRASPATTYYENSDGTLTSFAANVVRIGDRGILSEVTRTNVVLHNRDLTNAAWTKTNVTAAKDQTGPDGVANSASKITSTAANGTCLQAITLASSARWQSAFVKRVTGTGTIEMTMDNGATWTAITVTSSWTPVEIATQTLANPTVGFRIVTSGDAVAVDFVQNENSDVQRTSPIPTTTASVTRSTDIILQKDFVSSRIGSVKAVSSFVRAEGNTPNNASPGCPLYAEVVNTAALYFTRPATTSTSVFYRNIQASAVFNATFSSASGFQSKKNQTFVTGLANNNFGISDESLLTTGTIDTSGEYQPLNRWYIGGQNTSQLWNGYVSRVAYWLYRLSNEDLRLISTFGTDLLFITEGDSILISPTGDSNMTTYVRNTLRPTNWQVQSLSASGSSFSNSVDAANTSGSTRLNALQAVYDLFKRCNPRIKTVLLISSGHNDFSVDGDSTATFQSQLDSYLASLQTRGFRGSSNNKIAMIPCTPSTVAGKNTFRNTVNAYIATLVGSTIDYFVDETAFAGNTDGDASDVNYWVDGIHPSAAHAATWAAQIKSQVLDVVAAL